MTLTSSAAPMIPEGVAWDTFVLDLMRQHWDVRFISRDELDAQKLDTGTSPFAVAHQRGGIAYLEKGTVASNRPKEIGHEFGHAVHCSALLHCWGVVRCASSSSVGRPPADPLHYRYPSPEVNVTKVRIKNFQAGELHVVMPR